MREGKKELPPGPSTAGEFPGIAAPSLVYFFLVLAAHKDRFTLAHTAAHSDFNHYWFFLFPLFAFLTCSLQPTSSFSFVNPSYASPLHLHTHRNTERNLFASGTFCLFPSTTYRHLFATFSIFPRITQRNLFATFRLFHS